VRSKLYNAARSGFDPLENCAAPSQCDASAGSGTDPCQPGSVRCTPQGRLERCVDRLSGWQVSADCLTPAVPRQPGYVPHARVPARTAPLLGAGRHQRLPALVRG